MDEIFNVILKNTYTTSQFKHRLRILRDFFNQKFFSGISQIELTEVDKKWLSSLPKDFFEKFTKDNLTSTFTTLDTKLSQTPTLVLNIAFDPTDEALAQIGEYTRKNFTSFSLIQTKYDPRLIAGCSLIWKGINKDYSLKSQIEGKKEAILENFKKYLR